MASTIGPPVEPRSVTKRFEALSAAARLRRLRFHDLRHCCASLILANDVPLRMVMEILGHTQLATTADLYSHVMPAAQREAVELMDLLLAGNA